MIWPIGIYFYASADFLKSEFDMELNSKLPWSLFEYEYMH